MWCVKRTVQIYAMGVFEPAPFVGLSAAEQERSAPPVGPLEQTGGRALAASNPAQLPTVASRIGIELRISMCSHTRRGTKSENGKFRKVEIKLVQPQALSALKARWRVGYYAPSQKRSAMAAHVADSANAPAHSAGADRHRCEHRRRTVDGGPRPTRPIGEIGR